MTPISVEAFAGAFTEESACERYICVKSIAKKAASMLF